MRRLRRHSEEARRLLRTGHPTKAMGELANLDKLLDLLARDADKARRDQRQSKGRNGRHHPRTSAM
jgi:hypothetical protein